MALTLFIVSMLTSCGLEVPRPEVKTGEFNFSVTYDLHGEVKTVSGVYICEFDGIGWSLDGGHHRSWEFSFRFDTEDVVFDYDSVVIANLDGEDSMWISFDFYPQYFMGDSDWSWLGEPEPTIIAAVTTDEGFYYERDADIIYETYGARIISYEYDEPIENTFSLFNFI